MPHREEEGEGEIRVVDFMEGGIVVVKMTNLKFLNLILHKSIQIFPILKTGHV